MRSSFACKYEDVGGLVLSIGNERRRFDMASSSVDSLDEDLLQQGSLFKEVDVDMDQGRWRSEEAGRER